VSPLRRRVVLVAVSTAVVMVTGGAIVEAVVAVARELAMPVAVLVALVLFATSVVTWAQAVAHRRRWGHWPAECAWSGHSRVKRT
jgi:hypothetical protein